MVSDVAEKPPRRVVMTPECSMSDNVAGRFQTSNSSVRATSAPMRRITLPGILLSLRRMATQVHVDVDVAGRARLAVERMLAGRTRVRR